MWETRFIPTELVWIVLVLISKGNADTRRIALLEVVWKVVEAVIDTRIKSVVQFHNVLQGFCTGRGIGTAIMDLRLTQELANVYHDPIFLVFLDLRKLYDNLDRGRLLQTLEGYGAGPNLWGLLA